jgi:hypothetical protein
MRTSSNGKPKRHLLAGTASTEALEKEAVEALGSGYYEHVADRRGYRNGYRRSRVKSAEGEIEFAVPQLADTAAPFRSKIREVLSGRPAHCGRVSWPRLDVDQYAPAGLPYRLSCSRRSCVRGWCTSMNSPCQGFSPMARLFDECPWLEDRDTNRFRGDSLWQP